MIDFGIPIPPKSPDRLQTAASVAGLMITTECMVTEIVEDAGCITYARHGWQGGMGSMM